MCAMNRPTLRLRLAQRLGAHGHRLFDETTIVEYLRAQGAQIGDGSRLHITSLGSEPYLVSIGNETLVSVGVLFVTHDGGTWAFRDQHPEVHRFGRIVVGSRVFIGANAVILPHVHIGDRSVVGAGSVVADDVPAGTVVAGVPARVLMSTDEYYAKCKAGPALDYNDATKRRVLETTLPWPGA